MKVTHFIWTALVGGIEKIVVDLVCEQRQMGIDASVAVGQAKGEYLQTMKSAGIPVQSLNLKGGMDFSFSRKKSATKIFEDSDVVQLHAYHPLVAAAAQSAKNVVFTEHGNFAQGRKTTIRDRVKGWMMKRFLNQKVDFVTFNSNFTKREAEKRYGLATTARKVVENGIKVDQWKPESKKSKHNEFIVGTCARFKGCKRIDRLVDGFAGFRENSSEHLLLVGDGELRVDIESQIKSLDLEEHSTITGFQTEPLSFYQKMDVVVLPTQTESFGLVAIEAMLLGKPVIVFHDGGGVTEIVDAIEPDNCVKSVEELSQRLRYFRKNGIQNFAQQRIAYAKQFSIQNMAVGMSDVYDELSDKN